MDLVAIQELKSACRQRQKEFFSSLTAEEKEAAAVRVAEILPRQPAWQRASAILFYSALPNEINLFALLRIAISVGKTVALPQWNPISSVYAAARIEGAAENLVKGSFGVLEPLAGAEVIPWKRLDLALAPGVAFDLRGVRLGRGKGFYDRMLAQVQGGKCGVCYDAQVMAELPLESHDIRMNCLLTPTRWFEFPPEGT